MEKTTVPCGVDHILSDKREDGQTISNYRSSCFKKITRKKKLRVAAKAEN
jgi:hypothetical protein